LDQRWKLVGELHDLLNGPVLGKLFGRIQGWAEPETAEHPLLTGHRTFRRGSARLQGLELSVEHQGVL